MMASMDGTMDRRSSRLSRREFMAGAGASGLGLVAGCGRLPWQAQQPPKVPRIGFLDLVLSPAHNEWFEEGLRRFGYVNGQNIVIEYRWAERTP